MSNEVEQLASQHAGRPIVKGCGPWLREQDVYTLSVDGVELSEKEAMLWLQKNRPDLKGSLKDIHDAHAVSRWVDIKGFNASIYRGDGADSGYVYDWVTTEIEERNSYIGSIGNTVDSGVYIQELQLQAPDHTVLGVFGRRRFSFSQGNYPTGDYKRVEELDMLPKLVQPAANH